MSDEKKEKKNFKRPIFHKIVNVFIGFFAILFFLLIVFFGFSQTKTFRGFLKNQITDQVSNSINGNLYIERIDGSIFSSIILNNTVLTSLNDTLIDAEQISIKTSPVHLLLKRILIREISIRDAKINLLQDSEGVWNLSRLSKSEDEPVDTSKSTFPFTIQVNNLNFQNLSFIRQTYPNLKSNKYYNHINTDDLRFTGMFLDAKIFANLSASLVRMDLNNLSVTPNFKSFNLKKLSGHFELTENFALVKNLFFETDSTNLAINAKMDKLNLLGNVELRDFKDYPIEIEATATPFHFNDLSTFIEATDFLRGNAHFDLKATGYFGDFDVSKLSVAFKNSDMQLNGNVKNLHIPSKLFFDVKATSNKLVESEIFDLVEGLQIPRYENLIAEKLSLSYKGEPTKFKANLTGNVNDGKIFLDTYLDLQKEKMEYDIKFATEKINVFPIVGFNSSITGNGSLKGIGTDPEDMDANFIIDAKSSNFYDIKLDSLKLVSQINSKIFNLDFNALVNNAKTSVKGILDLRNSENPTYDLNGATNNLNLQTFTNNKSDSSNLNFAFMAKGTNLNLDKLIGEFEIKLEPSQLRELKLDETNIKLSLKKEEELRKINLVSEFVDFNINGNFSLEKAIELLTYEGKTIAYLISKKIDELNPIEDQSVKNTEIEMVEISPIVNESVEFNYDFTFKDFNLIAIFLKNDELDISGSGTGTVKNDSLQFRISTEIDIQNLLNKKDSLLLYLSDSKANLNFSRDNQEISFNKIFGSVSLEGDKIYAGAELNDVQADFIFNQSKLFFNTSLGVGENLTTEMEGTISTFAADEEIRFNAITLNYKNIPWASFDTSSVIFTGSGIQLSNLILENANALVTVNGQINNDESHNFFVEIENLPGEILSSYFANENDNPLKGDVNLNFSSTGFLTEPELNGDISFNEIAYNDVVFGSLTGKLKHYKNVSQLDFEFNNPKLKSIEPILTLHAVLPFSLNYKGGNEVIDPDSDIDISLKSSDFNLGAFGNLIPYIKNQSGIIQSNIQVNGTYSNTVTNGFLNVEDGRFTFIENNLDYSFLLNSTFEDQIATINQFQISNHAGSKYTGKINAVGEIELKEFPFNKIDVSINGSLALLGSKSKTKDASIYGDLFIKTDNNWKFTYENDRYNFDGDILVDKAELVYASKNQANGRFNNRIVYKFVEDSSNINWENQKFIRILNETNNSKTIKIEDKTKFDYNTNIIIRNIASFNFLIDPELNQKLNLETTGRLEFATVNDQLRTQGALELLDGSRIEFFKTFDAKGTIRFESDVIDPHLNIVGTYIGEIDNFEASGRTEEVAVKLKINSPLSKLGENLSAENENLSVYVGRTNIDNDIPDLKYGASNALTFILLGQLSLDLNEEQKTALGAVAENTAYSLLGSQLTSYLNSTLGGLVSNIRFNKYSSNNYKLLFSGKYNNIRYSFGGNTKYLEWNKTDIKFEYLINPSFIIRMEQKDPIVETTTGEKIQELGLKYKFEF